MNSMKPAVVRVILASAIALAIPMVASAQIGRVAALFPAQFLSGEHTGDQDIIAARFFTDGRIETPVAAPASICSQNYKEFSPIILPDTDGGCFLVYTVEHNSSAHAGDRDILMRRLDREGRDRWGDSTNHITPIARSNFREQNARAVKLYDGSIMVLYEVHYSASIYGDVDIAAVKIGADGKPVWGSGSWVAKTKRRELLSGAVADSRGGVIAVYESASIAKDSVVASDLLAMRIDGYGKAAWGASANPVHVASSRHLERNAAVVSDGAGGAYVAYEIAYTAGDRTGDIDILAQRIAPDGTRRWIDETALPLVSSDAKARETEPVVVAEPAGLAVAFKIQIGHQTFIGMQRLDMLGKPLWNEGKKAVLTGIPKGQVEHQELIADGLGNFYLSMEVTGATDTVANDRDIFVQRIAADGAQAWGDGEYAVAAFNTPTPERDATLTVDPLGQLIILAVRDTPTANPGEYTSQVIAQKFAIDGASSWASLQPPIILSEDGRRYGKMVLLRE